MTNAIVKQTNRTEIEWTSEDQKISVSAVVVDAVVTDVVMRHEYPRLNAPLAFSIHGSNEIDDLLEGLQCIKEKIASCVWKAGVCDTDGKLIDSIG